ncbi:MAG: stage II sporulation protein M [Desulfurococcales archaeon]|nr:stage II sporulation protein M [Desulfurococcales archaeon]
MRRVKGASGHVALPGLEERCPSPMRLLIAFSAATASFVAGLAAGLAAPAEGYLEALRRILGSEGPRWFTVKTMVSIFLHNLSVALLVYALSIIIVGLALVAFNGYIVGTVVVAALHRGLSLSQVAAALIPHGVVELPAVLLASALGLQAHGALRGKPGLIAETARRLWVVVVLLAVAAAIETYVTPAIAAGVAS